MEGSKVTSSRIPDLAGNLNSTRNHYKNYKFRASSWTTVEDMCLHRSDQWDAYLGISSICSCFEQEPVVEGQHFLYYEVTYIDHFLKIFRL